MRVNIFFKKDSEVVATIELKRSITGDDILGIIVGKFRYWQQLCPIILLIIDKWCEICFYRADLSVDLTIGWKLEGCR